MTVATRNEFIDQIETLPPLPAITQQILAVTESPASSAEEVAKVLCQDQAIAAKVLRVANSPFYGVSRKITQVSRAVVILGTSAVSNLVLGLCARATMSQPATRQFPEHAALWRHSMAVAAVCEMIARRVGYKPPEEAFVAGLLHDLGQLAMSTFQPELFSELSCTPRSEARYLQLEGEYFGIDHSEAGYRILTHWGLPESLCQIVRRHHHWDLDGNAGSEQLFAMLTLGNMFSHLAGFSLDAPVGSIARINRASQILGLTVADQLTIFEKIDQQVEQTVEVLGGTMAAAVEPRRSDLPSEIIWVSQEGAGQCSICQTLAKQRGYQIRLAGFGQLGPSDVSSEAIVVVDSASQDAADELVAMLLNSGHRHIVVLRDDEPLRQRDDKTGVLQISRVFTVFDLKWVEERLLS
jgi:putative nucleotidyltransferase with HDIG domain